MKDHMIHGFGSVRVHQTQARIAVIGAGIAGLTCARELRLRGHDAVVFEASDRLGGRCSSLATNIGWFDDGAQSISGVNRLASYAAQRPGELPALHQWTVPETAAEDQRIGKIWDEDEEDTAAIRSLKPMGVVGVPSMLALAQAVAQPLEVRLRTPIRQAQRRGAHWRLRTAVGEIDEDFQALVLALPAPLALPLAQESPALAAALGTVQYRSRWLLLLGSERHVGLPGYREFQGSPIERVAAMHSKPGRSTNLPQRWFVEADERWSLQHEHDDAEMVAELMLDNFRAHACRKVTPIYLRAHQWRHALVASPATLPGQAGCLWDPGVRLGVCGDSVVPSRVDRVHASGVALALALTLADGLSSRRDYNASAVRDRDRSEQLEVQM